MNGPRSGGWRRRPGSPRLRSGIVLLQVLMVVTILFVLIGQFSYSVSLDRMLAENEVKDLQARLDLQSAAEVFRAAMAQGGAESPIEVELSSGTATVRWESEAGKFNVNRLRAEQGTDDAERLERLFRLLEENGTVSELSLAGRITDLVLTSDRPLLTMDELERIEGVDETTLHGVEGRKGLASYLTVYSDGTVNIGEAPVEIIASYDDRLVNENLRRMLKQKLEDPDARVPDWIEQLARSLRDSRTTRGEAYRADIVLRGEFEERSTEVAIRLENGAFRFVLYNERGPADAAFE